MNHRQLAHFANTYNKAAHKVLLAVRDDKRKTGAICESVRRLATRLGYSQATKAAIVVDLMNLYPQWQYFTGRPPYPVPCTEDLYCRMLAAEYVSEDYDAKGHAPEAYQYARSKGLIWAGDYGALRQNLLDFLIERTA